MKIEVDTDSRQITIRGNEATTTIPLYSDEAFTLLSRWWTKVGWNQKYTYTFSWLGRPVIQLPEDLIRAQEVIYRIRPDVIIECGIAHGGSLVFYASICKALDHGRVIGVDVEIRPPNRAALENHELRHLITLIEGSSTELSTVSRVHSLVKQGESALVILDSRHDSAHVLRELQSYCDIVPVGSYIVAADGVMHEVSDTPRGNSSWRTDNPAAAVAEFLKGNPNFVLQPPDRTFDEGGPSTQVTYWTAGWIRRIR